MQFEVDEEVARIRQRIRRWREEGHLTLQQLASRSGLATSTIQKVETGQMVPSLAVLLKMARGLGRDLTDLVEDEGSAEVLHLRACERRPLGLDEQLEVERLSGDLARPALETWRVTLRPGVSSGADPLRYEGEELVVCEKGFVTFRVGEQEYRLHPGDSLHFKADLPHSWFNEGDEPACFTVTGTLPPRFRALIQSRIANAEPRSETPLSARPHPPSAASE